MVGRGGRGSCRQSNLLDRAPIVPAIVDYSIVKQTVAALGLVSLYHESGAFGFPPGVEVSHVGWIGPADPTLRPAAQATARQAPPPHPRRLAEAAARALATLAPSAVWLLPMSHWAFELNFGGADGAGGDWLKSFLPGLGIDPAPLRDRADGSAISFEPQETPALTGAIAALLTNLATSDFALLAPPLPLIGLIHHHQQLWWTTPSATIATLLRELPLD